MAWEDQVSYRIYNRLYESCKRLRNSVLLLQTILGCRDARICMPALGSELMRHECRGQRGARRRIRGLSLKERTDGGGYEYS
jgi:hypothetical protein